MVELQRFHTPIVAAPLTTAAFVNERLPAYLLPPFLDGLDEIVAAIGVRPSTCHRFTLLTATCSTD
jgi:hypothetical protein